MLDMYGNQIGNYQRPVQFLPGTFEIIGIDNHRHGNCDALISTSRINDYRQLAAAHSRIGSGCSHRLTHDLYVISVGFYQDASNIGAPVMFHSLTGNSVIIGNLPIQYFTDIFQIYFLCKLNNIFHTEERSVSLRHLFLTGSRLFPVDDFPIFGDHRYIAVCSGDPHFCLMLSRVDRNQNIQLVTVRQGLHIKRRLFQIFPHPVFLFVCHRRDHFQLFLRTSADNAGRRRRRNTFQPVCVRHDHTFYIFNNISTGLNFNPLRNSSQHFSGFCRTVGDGNRLCASERRNKFFLQDLHKSMIHILRQHHSLSLPFPLFFPSVQFSEINFQTRSHIQSRNSACPQKSPDIQKAYHAFPSRSLSPAVVRIRRIA